ncbi:MAG: acylphosphatase [Desulfobacter sp.]
MSEKIAVQVKVTGRVQGVFFRAETRKAAQKFRLEGFVKNMPDGSVQALLQGSRKNVDQMLEWCWQGSPLSGVDGVNSQPIAVQPDIMGFDIRY